ncbi:MAG: hypothetical protein ACYS7Y_11670 [Planctomycetota bacterium]|jgi:hypothetical protein
MKSFFSSVGGLLLAAALIVGVVFGGSYLGLTVYRTFGTAYESARTDVYRENKSYVEGTIRDLREMKRDYVTADEGHQDALRSLILHRAGELDWDRLPSDVRGFLNELEGE